MDLVQNRHGAAQSFWPLDRGSIWKPLDKEKREIRIILLQPSGEEDDALYADLEIASLDNEPAYNAISYVWGDASDTTVMFLNGGKVIEITKSLAAALRRFRHSRIFVALWADAVCINQENLQERADQVSIMGKIYASAIQVNVWLGRMSDRKWHDSWYSYLEAEDLLRTDALLHKQEAFFEHLFGEVIEDDNGRPEKITPGHFEKFEHLWRRIEDAGADQEEEFRGRDDMWLAKRVISAQLFLTAKGRLGNAKTGVQAGDLVTLFPDCSMPFILRPAEDGAKQKSFKLISPCYIHGIMDGEALWDTFMAKANLAEKTAFQKDFDALQERIAVGIKHTERKALRAELADKHCHHLFEEIVLV
ncbi:hypothetical protein D0864_00034 [Hortaea werneckii]|uniref:Heterokaryon incompatibility domain-containing protein n=1 Tax=Hortaea werneckii TaxID=91943 RepID=A0A3M7H2H2_HORWE|nr:hypothetical protein KC323_g6627 [Hortaea werneckii]KAI6863039.1 hypothetical protein KC338_g6071 [Hortaea werneckii]KAI7294634.1 hypothetical protein KC352_g1064 [Hortaea werneckii]KAI7684124.1 hypothetical protein KC319_g86 [Hortaea werneckii]KAI7724120.1 hypothetical protein KC322_g278 [Hortaea werneckii]